MRPARKIAASAPGSAPADVAGIRRPEALWVAWNGHRRTTGLCAAWGVPLHVIPSQRRGPARKIEQALRTLLLLRRERPEILFIQNPSLVLTILALLVRKLFSFYLVIDAHNEGVRPYDRPGAIVRWITRRALNGADSTIVTNAALATDVTAAGGRPLVLSDSLPVAPPLPRVVRAPEALPEIAVIATFRRDEPIAALMEAAAAMPDVRFAFSGDSSRFRETGIRLPANVRLTGFLPERQYWELLAQAAVVCDLTLKPDCLVCGAYEALALAKPMVLSDDPATRELFGPAAVLTRNEPGAIVEALRTALARRETLAANARALREAFGRRWPAQAAAAWNAVLEAAAARRGAN